MPVIRLIYVKVDPSQCDEAERIWKADCAPLMIKQDGCRTERLLRCLDEPGEYISYSEWDDGAAIDKYRASDDHKKIQEHSRNLQGARATVKRYDTVS